MNKHTYGERERERKRAHRTMLFSLHTAVQMSWYI